MYLQRGFLSRLAHGGGFNGLTNLYKAAGQRPPQRRVFAPYQHDRAVGAVDQLDNNIGREQGRYGHDHPSGLVIACTECPLRLATASSRRAKMSL
jgi:hypothetical protein